MNARWLQEQAERDAAEKARQLALAKEKTEQELTSATTQPTLKIMKLLNTYEDRDDAEAASEKITGEKRLASERDATVVIYNLFGIPSWGNFHRLGMYNLGELKALLDRRAGWQAADHARHAKIIVTLKTVEKNYEIAVPEHWL